VRDLKETFWGDLYGKTRLAWKRFLEEESRKERDRSVGVEDYERAGERRRSYRNGFYVRDFVTRLGTLRLRVARSRDRSFRPPGLERFQRRAAEVMLLIREAFLRGLSTRQVGRVVAILTGEAVSAQTVYPQVKHQRCWVHKMRNILEHVRKRDYEAVKADAQAIYRAESRREAERAFRRFRARWQGAYAAMVKRLERDLPELLTFFDFPQTLWRQLRTTNVIERCFVEVRRRTRPMVCFVNVESVDRIIYAIFNGYNEQHQWRNRTLRLFTQAA
jgi:transposase-like protein